MRFQGGDRVVSGARARTPAPPAKSKDPDAQPGFTVPHLKRVDQAAIGDA
jgi:hypothetical protein